MDEIKVILNMLSNKDCYSKCIMHLKIMEILIYIVQNDKSNSFCPFMKSCLDEKADFQKFVEENFTKYSSIEEMALNYAISISTFKRKFYNIYNTTPGKWLNEKKLEKAKNLLSITDYNITEICHLSGFESLSTFSSNFQAKYGMSPREFRKRTL
jgi:AraC-like DNA-binding protein